VDFEHTKQSGEGLDILDEFKKKDLVKMHCSSSKNFAVSTLLCEFAFLRKPAQTSRVILSF
jgi:hypothetical protein